uniref:Uncharacterized protein n=1 Tax=Heterorhabditis bacteriophora TaxID=37862 RepID=A0A1I7XET6_HETBA
MDNGITREKIGTGTDSSRDTRDTDGTLTEEGRASFSSSVSGKDVGRTLPDTKRTQRGRQSDRSGKNEGAVISYASQSRIEMNGNFYQGLRNDTLRGPVQSIPVIVLWPSLSALTGVDCDIILLEREANTWDSLEIQD